MATTAIARPTRTALPIGAERGHRGAVTPADAEHQQVHAGTAAGRALLLVFDVHLVAYCERRASRGLGGIRGAGSSGNARSERWGALAAQVRAGDGWDRRRAPKRKRVCSSNSVLRQQPPAPLGPGDGRWGAAGAARGVLQIRSGASVSGAGRWCGEGSGMLRTSASVLAHHFRCSSDWLAARSWIPALRRNAGP